VPYQSCWVVVADVQLREHVVDDPVLEVRHPGRRPGPRRRPASTHEDETGAEQDAHCGTDRTSNQRDQQPEHMVNDTFAIVKTTVRSSVCQKIGSLRTEL